MEVFFVVVLVKFIDLLGFVLVGLGIFFFVWKWYYVFLIGFVCLLIVEIFVVFCEDISIWGVGVLLGFIVLFVFLVFIYLFMKFYKLNLSFDGVEI